MTGSELGSMVVTLTLIYRSINQLSTVDQVKSLSIVEEDCPEKRLKGLKACLQWKVHLAYPASLQTFQSNTQKQIIQIQHNKMMVERFPLLTSVQVRNASCMVSVVEDPPRNCAKQVGIQYLQCCWLDVIKSAKSSVILAIQLVKAIRCISFSQVLCRLLFWGLVSCRRTPNIGQPLLLTGGVQGSGNRVRKICAYSVTKQLGATSGPQAFARFTLHKTM